MKCPRISPRFLPLPWALLPYIATLFGVYLLDQGLVAVAVYHLGIVAAWVGCRYPLKPVFRGMDGPVFFGLGVLCLLTGPILWFLWPYMARPGVELSVLLSQWGLTGGTAWAFALYSITLHPVLEEGFWRGMLPNHLLSDALFAGFHLLVLAPLIHAVWLPLVFVVLLTASGIWRHFARKTKGLLLPILTHALADLGVVLAVRALVLA